MVIIYGVNEMLERYTSTNDTEHVEKTDPAMNARSRGQPKNTPKFRVIPSEVEHVEEPHIHKLGK